MLPISHRESDANRWLLARSVASHPLLALLRPSVIEALEAVLSCGRDLTGAEAAFVREVVCFLEAAETQLSREARP